MDEIDREAAAGMADIDDGEINDDDDFDENDLLVRWPNFLEYLAIKLYLNSCENLLFQYK